MRTRGKAIRELDSQVSGLLGAPVLTNADTINAFWDRMVLEYEGVDQEQVKRYLNRKKYRTVYLTTFWWYIISYKRKLMDGFKCTHTNCSGDCRVLEVHHPNYDHRGEEIKFMDSIKTLCHTCHLKEHDLEFDAPKFGKGNKVVVLTKTEEAEDQNKLQEFYEKNGKWLSEDVEIVSEPKKYTVIVKTQILNTKELREAILNDLDTVLAVL